MKTDTWYKKIWFGCIIVALPLGAVGLGLALGFGIQFGAQNYYATSWKSTECHVFDVSTAVESVWYLDEAGTNVTTICDHDDMRKSSPEAALAEGISRYPIGTISKTCRYNPQALQECRLTAPDPETPKIILLVCMAGLVPFTILVYAAQGFIASRCCTKSFWNYF